LTVFLGVILTKKYTNPSADIITVIAGLDEVDAVFSEFANIIESSIRSGRSGMLEQQHSRRHPADLFNSSSPAESDWCCFVPDFRGLPNQPRVLFHTSRSVSCFDEGTRIIIDPHWLLHTGVVIVTLPLSFTAMPYIDALAILTSW